MAEKSVGDLVQEIKDNPALEREIKEDPKAALAQQATAAYTTDRKFYRIAVVGLMGIIVLVVVSAVVIQIWKEQNISDWESALATTALGGLVGLFAPSPGATK